jgi:ABC-2 type transport system permease protein
MILKYLLEKEFKQFLRNPLLPKFIFVFPFVMLALLPLAANFEVKDVKLSLIDNSHSTLSNRLIHKLESSGYFVLSDVSNSYRNSLHQVEHQQCDVILEIPASFESDLMREQASNVSISSNSVDAMKGALSSMYLVGMLAEFNSEIRAELLPAGATASLGIETTKIYKYNPKLKYKYAMVPAIMVMLLSIICGFLPAFNIVMEKEQGTIEQMNVTPVQKSTLILSKLIPYWVTGFIVLNLCFGIAWLFYGMVPAGSILTIYLFASVYVLAMSGLGLVISNYAKTLQQSMFMVFFIIITFIFLGGLYTPVENMPDWAQFISNMDPIKFFVRVMRLIYLKGSSTTEMMSLLLSLIGFAVVFNTWAIISYHKKS